MILVAHISVLEIQFAEKVFLFTRPVLNPAQTGESFYMKVRLHGTTVFAQGCVSLPLFYEKIFGHEFWCTCHIFDN